jgi:hypothetical protein
MPSSLNGTGVTFNDGTQLNSKSEAGGNYIQRTYNGPATWTKPAGLKAVKVTVVGAGGNGGNAISCCSDSFYQGGDGASAGAAIRFIPAPSIPGPVAVTVGSAPSKTSSFGSFVSATGGGNGTNSSPTVSGVSSTAHGTGTGGDLNFTGSPTASGFGFGLLPNFTGGPSYPGLAGLAYGGRAFGAGTAIAGPSGFRAGANGGPGVTIVEEFY